MEAIIFKTATEITQMIRDQEISSVEVVSQFLDQIKRYDTSVNAISDLREEADILKEAQEKDCLLAVGKIMGPLHGLPMTVKDSYNVKGLLSTNGNPALRSNIANSDAELVKRLKEAGAIIIGKTNLALYALDWQSTNKWFGQTNNPYNPEYVVGGSSGGSAAALAAGFTPLELGTDAGGSIRVPAHFCGVCGIRTTESALPLRGNMSSPGMLRIGRYLTCNGPMARNVDDLLLIMKVLWTKEQEVSENPPVNFTQYEYDPSRAINIAYSTTLGGIELDKEYEEVYLNFIDKIDKSKHLLTLAQPDYDSDELTNLWGRIAGFDFGVALKGIPFKKWIAYLFIKTKYRDSQWAKGMGQGASITPRKYAKALQRKDDVSDAFSAFFQKYDIWITPVSAGAAFKHQEPGIPLPINETKLPYTKAFIPFNFPTTIPGHPIVVIPIGVTKSGLPVGVQIHGQKWKDHKVLQIARELEKLTAGFSIPQFEGN